MRRHKYSALFLKLYLTLTFNIVGRKGRSKSIQLSSYYTKEATKVLTKKNRQIVRSIDRVHLCPSNIAS